MRKFIREWCWNSFVVTFSLAAIVLVIFIFIVAAHLILTSEDALRIVGIVLMAWLFGFIKTILEWNN